MANSHQKKMKEVKAATSTSSISVCQLNCQGIKLPKTMLIKPTSKNNVNVANDTAGEAVKNKKGRWSKLRRNISNVFMKNKVEKHSTMLKSLSLNQVLKIEEKGDEKKSSEEGLSKVIAVNGVKMRRMRSVKMKQRDGKFETEEKRNGEKQELCKKRILMGGKCKPLNRSGVLHYDHNGILLPEDVQ